MKKIFKKIIPIILILTVILSCVGCSSSKDTSTKYDNYSIGLDTNGFYKTLDDNKTDVNITDKTFNAKDVLEWGRQRNNTESDTEQTLNEFIENYTKEVLVNLGVAYKEVAEEKDIVTLRLDFYIGDKQLTEFYGEKTFEITSESDSIVKGAIGHKANEEYEAEYVFDKDDPDYPSQTATVKVKILEIIYENPLKDELITKYQKEINEVVEGVTNVETLLVKIRPKLAEALLFDYISDQIQTDTSIKVPQEYIDHEVYRLKSRLEKVGYSYEDYLEVAKVTDEETVAQCEKFARENYVIMLYAKQNKIEVKDTWLDEYYGESRATAVSIQGLPYMKLTLMREVVISDIMTKVNFVGEDGEKIAVEPINWDEPLDTTTETTKPTTEENTETDANKK